MHIVLGDLNLAIDPSVDSSSGARRDSDSRSSLLRWCASLGVTDAWRLHNPTARQFSGAIPRRNRLDYVLLDDQLLCEHYTTSEYCGNTHGGDPCSIGCSSNHRRAVAVLATGDSTGPPSKTLTSWARSLLRFQQRQVSEVTQDRGFETHLVDMEASSSRSSPTSSDLLGDRVKRGSDDGSVCSGAHLPSALGRSLRRSNLRR